MKPCENAKNNKPEQRPLIFYILLYNRKIWIQGSHTAQGLQIKKVCEGHSCYVTHGNKMAE